MRNQVALENRNRDTLFLDRLFTRIAQIPRQIVIGILLVIALFAFELFNFDTTRYALQSFLGDIRFAGIGWATILAIAFCTIDFAGLARLLTPVKGQDEPKEIWYLTGAWLLGATMNAVMTWWAVSLVLLDHNLGNELLSRQDLLSIVPVFVAILVWITRILFIGALAISGERMIHSFKNRNSGKHSVNLSKKQQNRRTVSRRRTRETERPKLNPIALTSQIF